jgi:hypothetical protein
MSGETLRVYLQRAGWSPRELAHAVNARLKRMADRKHQIHPTAPYHWLSRGYCPYPPIPEVVAEVLSERLGQPITADLIWPGRTSALAAMANAGTGLAGPWAPSTAVRLLDDLVRSSGSDRRRIRPSNGLELVTLTLDGLAPPADPVQAGVDGEKVLPPMMDLVADHIAALRRLDDRQGGGMLSLRYVLGELRTVLDLIKGAAYSQEVGGRLHLAAADLAQLTGWMHFDAGIDGAGQRYFLLGLRLARAGDDLATTANIMGMLAYHVAHAGQPTEAIRIAEAACDVARRASIGMQARAAGRLATAHAAAGDIHSFRGAADRARTLLARRRPDDDPASIYYLSSAQLDAEAGQALVDLAAQNPGHARHLLAEAVELLTPLTSAGLREDFQRSALLHGGYLALAHLHRRDLEQAASATQTALTRLPGVQSGRCRSLLTRLRRELARRKRNGWVADLLPELDKALWTG